MADGEIRLETARNELESLGRIKAENVPFLALGTTVPPVTVAAPAVGKGRLLTHRAQERGWTVCKAGVSIVKTQTKFSKKDSYKHGQSAGKGQPRHSFLSARRAWQCP